jgi:hypothetical protein
MDSLAKDALGKESRANDDFEAEHFGAGDLYRDWRWMR